MIKYLLLILLFASCKNTLVTNEVTIQPTAEVYNIKQQINTIKNIAAEGDIIFRGGTDIESSIIRDFSRKDKLFSHCGILLKQGNKLQVTHILGGTTNPAGGIVTESIDSFLSCPQNESAGLYGITLSKKEKPAVYAYFDSLKKKKVTFDLRFDLYTRQQLYCTEIIINALSFVKGDHKLFPPTTFNLHNTKYFFLANNKHLFLFYPIDAFQHHLLLKKKAIFYFPNYNAS